MIIETNSEKETFELGKKIGENAKAGQIYTLTGDLGVGKTVFTQGLAAGLGITEPVNSPTFTIVQMYEDGRLPFYHFDVYRIGDIEEMEEIGYEDCFYGEGVCLIEWADLIQEILPPDVIAIEIEKNLEKGFDYRKITISDPEEKKAQLEEENMKVLGIDSSGLVASVAVVEDDILLAEYTVNYKKTHSQTLLPMLKEIGDMINLDLNSLDAIAIAAGPGSFTGLRIGSATAKGLGLALDKPIIPVPTVDGLAYDLWGTDKIVCPIMDARRNQVYTGIYEFCDGKLQILENQMAVSVTEIAEKLNALGREVIFLGDGVPVYRKTLAEVMKIPYSFAPAHMNRQRASAVAVLGAQYYVQGRAESAMEHKPDYLRLSQAERERKEREEQNRA